jgi:antagonist of KipI
MTEVLRVKEPGLFTTVQDLGRPNAIASGVSPGGAMDRFAHKAANLLVGNEPTAATLECTLRGPHLVAEQACLVAVAGADLDPRVNGDPVEMWAAFSLRAGDVLSFGSRRSGARAYLAIAGGVAGDRWLGSLSTNLLAQRGGMHGRPLQAGDVIAAAGEPAGPPVPGRGALPRHLRPDYADHDLSVIAGPHLKRLGQEGKAALFGSGFTVGRDSDRMGYRLDGPVLEAPGDEVLSFGLVTGAIQLPAGGGPILLMADHQTAGGYPVVATVISASLPIAAQLVPGSEVRFVEVNSEGAGALRHARDAALASLRG